MSGEIKLDEFAIENPEFYHMYGRTLTKVETLALRKQWRTEMTKGIWYWGSTGVGKSHRAFEGYHPDTHYVKDLNTMWWDGYKGQEIVILNEFRGQFRFSFLLELIDKWPLNVPIRNKESIPFLAKKVVITCNTRPEDLFSNTVGDRMDQLLRRCDVVELLKPNRGF